MTRTAAEEAAAAGGNLRHSKPKYVATSCGETLAIGSDARATDRNEGKEWGRYTTLPTGTNFPDENQFYISFHSQETDPVRWSTFETGTYYEARVTESAVEILGDPSTSKGLVLDVGMNIGWFTLLSRAMGHRVVSFEPNAMNHLRACESLKANGWIADGSVAIYKLGVSNVDDKTLQLTYGVNPGAASFRSDKKTEEHVVADIDMVTLDTMWKQDGWKEVKLLKIDVEGLDALVIEGAKGLLKSGVVENIFVEFSGLMEPEYAQMASTIVQSGYSLKVFGNWRGGHQEGGPEWHGGSKADADKFGRACNDFCVEVGRGTGSGCNLWFERA
jgi:FkbM family methyltransferase